ncbi:hypothetical protein SAMN05216533_0382 [Streptomyces sp. Ag109_O5-10]|nr:hypothetical protein SAMN05216533_0382 [Streptomyces sp. Ag109_O5-10]
MAAMDLRIDATDLPGRSCPAPEDSGFSRYGDIHVAVQRRNRPAELLDPHPGDAVSATWTLPCVAAVSVTGVDITGPHVQGGPGGRFVYLSWGTVDAGGAFTMFRRAKLMLGAVPGAVAEAAAREGLLVGRLGLTDGRGMPLCARVVPPAVEWSAGNGPQPSASQ